MSWKIKQKLRELLAAETNLCGNHHHNHGGSLSICLIYPNQYHTAMSSLGFQTVYRILVESQEIHCERAFLPDREDAEEYRRSGISLLSLESQRPISDFDVIAFSTSFEPDYLAIPKILQMSRIPLTSSERNQSHPLVIAGGAAFFINPEPVAEYIDAICIGEGEEILPALLSALTSPCDGGRSGLFSLLATLPGIYIPALSNQNSAPVQRVSTSGNNSIPATSVILTENTEFGDMYLVEISRGCPRGCRFCTSGFIYSPFRYQPLKKLITCIDEGLRHRNKIGLVGAAVSDHPNFEELCSYIVEKGGKVSVSSLRIDRITPPLLTSLKASGHKTIALAPEGGSQRMRDMMRKNLTESQILETSELIIRHDILNMRLYFIIGLPGETMNDLQELVRLVKAVRERVLEQARANGRLGEIILSINPFIPKPFTPFQWHGMEPMGSLEKKVKFLESSFRSLSNVRLKMESLRDCYLQALLSRGNRLLTPVLTAMAAGMNLKKSAKLCGIDTDALVTRTIPLDEALPWDYISSGDCTVLKGQYQQAFDGEKRP